MDQYGGYGGGGGGYGAPGARAGPPQSGFGQGPRPQGGGPAPMPRYQYQQQGGPTMGRADYPANNVEMASLAQNAGSFGQGRVDPNAILNECRAIDGGVDQVERNLQQLRMLQDRSLNEADQSSGSATSRQLDALSSATMTMYRDLTDRVRQVKSKAEAQQPMNAAQVNRIDRRLKQAITSYQQVESQFRKKTQEQMARQYRIVRPDAPDAEVRAAVEDVNGGQVFQQAMMQSARQGQARAVLNAVADRHRELQKIEQQMIELAQLFQDMDALVVQQDVVIAQTEQKTEEVVENLDKGNEEMAVAVQTAIKTRKKKWWCLGICITIIVAIAVIAVVYMFVTGKLGGNKENSSSSGSTTTTTTSPAPSSNTGSGTGSGVGTGSGTGTSPSPGTGSGTSPATSPAPAPSTGSPSGSKPKLKPKRHFFPPRNVADDLKMNNVHAPVLNKRIVVPGQTFQETPSFPGTNARDTSTAPAFPMSGRFSLSRLARLSQVTDDSELPSVVKRFVVPGRTFEESAAFTGTHSRAAIDNTPAEPLSGRLSLASITKSNRVLSSKESDISADSSLTKRFVVPGKTFEESAAFPGTHSRAAIDDTPSEPLSGRLSLASITKSNRVLSSKESDISADSSLTKRFVVPGKTFEESAAFPGTHSRAAIDDKPSEPLSGRLSLASITKSNRVHSSKESDISADSSLTKRFVVPGKTFEETSALTGTNTRVATDPPLAPLSGRFSLSRLMKSHQDVADTDEDDDFDGDALRKRMVVPGKTFDETSVAPELQSRASTATQPLSPLGPFNLVRRLALARRYITNWVSPFADSDDKQQ